MYYGDGRKKKWYWGSSKVELWEKQSKCLEAPYDRSKSTVQRICAHFSNSTSTEIKKNKKNSGQ